MPRAEMSSVHVGIWAPAEKEQSFLLKMTLDLSQTNVLIGISIIYNF